MLWWMAGCAAGPECKTGPDGYCVSEAKEDVDGDGFTVAEGDCDDTRAELDPGDADGDGFSTCEGDCDEASDQAPLRGPAVNLEPFVESCDNVDNDCNGVIDEDAAGGNPCVETEHQSGSRPVSLDLIYVADTDASFQGPSEPLQRELPAFFDRFVGTDTRVALLDSRSSSARLIGVQGRRWVSLLDATSTDVIQFLSAGATVTTRTEPNLPLTRTVDAVGLSDNADFFRTGNRAATAALVHTNTDERALTADEFLNAYDGTLYVFGPDPGNGCGLQPAPVLEASAGGGYYPNCGDHIGEDLLRAAEGLEPAQVVSESWLDEDFDVLPATRAATVTRVDGTIVELGPVDLDWDSTTRTMTVRDYVWADLVSADFRIQRVP